MSNINPNPPRALKRGEVLTVYLTAEQCAVLLRILEHGEQVVPKFVDDIAKEIRLSVANKAAQTE